eukprot:TRINITY_DN15801_c0_g1_i2.p1 TRINITY_DN15801_c0_g1~~TRINITY_DN15801_c0_g1_i2.p1  ORF type:complete len:221 (-),score=36.05 TRINITY_DN15801_c0_g1_i2:397-1059(-)
MGEIIWCKLFIGDKEVGGEKEVSFLHDEINIQGVLVQPFRGIRKLALRCSKRVLELEMSQCVLGSTSITIHFKESDLHVIQAVIPAIQSAHKFNTPRKFAVSSPIRPLLTTDSQFATQTTVASDTGSQTNSEPIVAINICNLVQQANLTQNEKAARHVINTEEHDSFNSIRNMDLFDKEIQLRGILGLAEGMQRGWLLVTLHENRERAYVMVRFSPLCAG